MLNLNIASDCGETPNSNRAQHLPWLECKHSLVRKYWSLNKFLVSSHSCEHDDLIMKYFFRIIATLAGLVAAYAIWQDLTSSYSASAPLGRLWYLYSPTTLQAAESIISRYVDPCGLITALDCLPFLWHPIIATILGWPAALVMIGFSIIFWWFGGLFGRNVTRPKNAARAFKRHGEK
jgi:hypothetical protein